MGRSGRNRFIHQGSIRSTARFLSPALPTGPGPGRELRVPKRRDGSEMPAARAKAELPDGSLGRWTGAEGSGPRCPSLHG